MNEKKRDKFNNMWEIFNLRVKIEKLIQEIKIMKTYDGQEKMTLVKKSFPNGIHEHLDSLTKLLTDLGEKDYLLASLISNLVEELFSIKMVEIYGKRHWINVPSYME